MSAVELLKYDDYKSYVKDWVAAQPKNGYGQFRRIAEQVKVSTVFVSQVFQGDRDLQPEHAAPLSRYMQHIELEERYFLNLIYAARAATADLRSAHHAQLKEIRQQAKSLKSMLKNEVVLSPEALARFHSGWAYSAVRLLTSVPGFSKAKAIADHLRLPPEEVHSILQFLVEHGLCVKQNDEFHMGPTRTHLPAESPLIKARQVSWRVKAFEKMEPPHPERMFFTAPMAISEQARTEIHALLRKTVISATKLAADSESEVLSCLNVDWFEI